MSDKCSNEKVKDIESFLTQLPKFNESMEGLISFRGHSKLEYELTPSVLRDGLYEQEHRIYNEIMTECSHEFDNCKLHNEILAKMQHYGVPTRLLDVTINPLIALYFACGGNGATNGEDGVVFVIFTEESKIKQYDSDTVSILSSLPRFNKKEKDKMLKHANKRSTGSNKKRKKSFNSRRIIKRLLHEIKKEKSAFEDIINPDDILENYLLIPRKINARIIRQHGAFIIFGLGKEKIDINYNYSNNISNRNKSYKIIIDGTRKEFIVKQLANLRISEDTMYPELYKVADHVKNKYKKEYEYVTEDQEN